MPATSLTPAMPAMAPLTSAAPSSVRETSMPANRAPCGLRPAARSRSPAGCTCQYVPRDGDRDDGQQEAEVEAGSLDERGELGRRRDPLGLREPGHRIAPRTVKEPIHEQQGDRVEEERRHDLVDPESHPQECGQEAPGRSRPRLRPPIMIGNATSGGRSPTIVPMPAAATAPRSSWPSGADVPVARTKRNRHGGAGEHDGRGADQDLEQGELRGQRHDEVRRIGGDRVGAGKQDRDGGDGEGQQDRREEKDRRRPRRDAHQAAFPRPAISMLSWLRSASATDIAPTIATLVHHDEAVG